MKNGQMERVTVPILLYNTNTRWIEVNASLMRQQGRKLARNRGEQC